MEKFTHWKKLSNPDYLGSWVLQPNEEIVGTINAVVNEVVTGADGKKEQCSVLHFEEKDLKPMVLNATNCKTITKLAGSPYIEQWKGLKIQIYSTKVKAFGDMVDALRIRPEIPNLAPNELDEINTAQSVAELIKICGNLKKKYPSQKQIILGRFNQRKTAIETPTQTAEAQ